MIRYTNIGYASSSTTGDGFYRRPKYISKKYTSTHDPHTSGMLIDLAERINQIVVKSLESGMNHSEITADVLIEPEVDDTKLDAFLQGFAVKEG